MSCTANDNISYCPAIGIIATFSPLGITCGMAHTHERVYLDHDSGDWLIQRPDGEYRVYLPTITAAIYSFESLALISEWGAAIGLRPR